MDFLHRTWAEIDHSALINNYNIVKSKINNGCMVMSVVKADAYGHGAIEVARTLERVGTDWFAVSNVEEALQLRRAGIKKPILVLGTTPAEYALLLAENNITQAVFCAEYAKALSLNASAQGVTVSAHIKLDTGMHRIGFATDSEQGINEAIEACKLPNIKVEGAFTHFASADMDGDPDGSYTERQFDLFCNATERLSQSGADIKIRHCCNSAAAVTRPEMGLEMVRAGIVLYGLAPSSEINPDGLRPVMSLRSAVSMVKKVNKGDDISYGRTYTADKERVIATVPVGYADGYQRSYSGSKVIVGSQTARSVGRICMDQMMIDVTDLGVKVGDTVTLFGTDGSKILPVDDLAKMSGTINYECVCLVTKRVTRVHTLDGKQISITTLLTSEEDKK